MISSFETKIINELSEQGFVILESEDLKGLGARVLAHAQKCDHEGKFRSAKIGKGSGRSVQSEIRSDRILWLDDFSFTGGDDLMEILQSVMMIAKTKLYLPVKKYECHLAHYEKGQFYKRHSDQHKNSPWRLLTFILYLNNLEEGEGGVLRVFPENQDEVQVLPKQGKLILFDSRIEHEVQESMKARWSLTGWFRSDG